MHVHVCYRFLVLETSCVLWLCIDLCDSSRGAAWLYSESLDSNSPLGSICTSLCSQRECLPSTCQRYLRLWLRIYIYIYIYKCFNVSLNGRLLHGVKQDCLWKDGTEAMSIQATRCLCLSKLFKTRNTLSFSVPAASNLERSWAFSSLFFLPFHCPDVFHLWLVLHLCPINSSLFRFTRAFLSCQMTECCNLSSLWACFPSYSWISLFSEFLIKGFDEKHI